MLSLVGRRATHTHSVLRFWDLGYVGAPRPLGFSARTEWGRPDLNKADAKQVKYVSQLIFTQLAIAEAVVLNGGIRLLEAPADPGAGPYPSPLATGEFTTFERRTSSNRKLICGLQCRRAAAGQAIGTCISANVRPSLLKGTSQY